MRYSFTFKRIEWNEEKNIDSHESVWKQKYTF